MARIKGSELTQEKLILKFHINELEECIDMIEDEIANKINNGNYKTEDSYIDVVLRCTGKSILTLRELILLCKNGFPDGALGLSRNLFEQFVIISMFETKCEGADRNAMVEKYCADYDVQRYKALIIMYEYAGKTVEAQDCKKEIAKLKRQFSVKRFSNYWWCGQSSFTNLCGHIIECADGNYKTMVRNLHISYKRACLALHANSFGNTNRIIDCFADIDLSPLDEGQEYALDLAVKSFIMVVMVLYRELGLNSKIVNKKLNGLALFYQNAVQDKET